jgi:hypothetical protein
LNNVASQLEHQRNGKVAEKVIRGLGVFVSLFFLGEIAVISTFESEMKTFQAEFCQTESERSTMILSRRRYIVKEFHLNIIPTFNVKQKSQVQLRIVVKLTMN